MYEGSVITLNETAIENNIRFLKEKLGKQVRISAVVKANAYGHGIEKTVPLFEKYGITHFSVFYYSEALRVHQSTVKPVTILIMGWIPENKMKDVLKKKMEFFVFNLERLYLALACAKQLNVPARIHLEAETGMNRSGLDTAQLKEAISIIVNNKKHLNVVGFCTHLAGAESISNHTRIRKQLTNYRRMLRLLENSRIDPVCKHVANSAATFVYPDTKMDMVRIGIMLYGFWSGAEVYIQYMNKKRKQTDPLRRILDWKSQVMAVKDVKAGEFVSYGTSYLAQTNIKTALVPVGYSLGYSRSLSNKGRVLIHGVRCGVIGVVNMNMMIVDVSNVPKVKVGDEVVIIGKQNGLEIKVSAFSDISEMLNYEVLTRLSESLERKVIKT